MKAATQNAMELVELIGREYVKQMRRADGGFIPANKLAIYTMEMLKGRARRNKNLRIFLDTVAYIHPHEDERMDLPWAKDPREPDPVIGVRPERAQRSRDDDIGLVPVDVQRITGSLK